MSYLIKKKQYTEDKKPPATAASQRDISAVDHAKRSSKSAITGNSGLTNSGPHVNYDKAR